MILAPFPMSILLRELVEGFGNRGVVFDEAPVEVAEPEEGAVVHGGGRGSARWN